METYDDPAWVHEFLGILWRRKKVFVESLAGARYDILELGGGSASSTVISPRIFDEFVAPYDGELIALAHRAGQRIAYHTCGGMMAILEKHRGHEAQRHGDLHARRAWAATPTWPKPAGGSREHLHDRRLRPVPFLQGLHGRADPRRGPPLLPGGRFQGGYILCPSDNFFDAEPELIKAFADEARKCAYPNHLRADHAA